MDRQTLQNTKHTAQSRSDPTDRSVSPGLNDAPLVPLLPEDIAYHRRRYETLLASSSEGIQAAGHSLFERIATPVWSVEWNLPRWLGETIELSETAQRKLLAANVFGLGFVRLRDDARDGELKLLDRDVSWRLETILLHAAEREYHALFPHEPWFWSQYDEQLRIWRKASLSPFQTGMQGSPASEAITSLADFGAPLLICIAAAVALANRHQSFAHLRAPVEHYLRAAVLFDHFKDWQDDLEHGRENIFINCQLRSRQAGREPADIRRQVYFALMDEKRMRDYTSLITGELELGATLARQAGMTSFSNHLLGLEHELSRSREQMLDAIAVQLNRAARILDD